MIVSPTYGVVARRSQTVKVEGTKKKKDWMQGEAEGIVRCSSFLLWVAEKKKEKFESWGIRNVNRLSQSRAGTVWNERVSTLTEGHARFWDHHGANSKIIGHYMCACVDVCVRVARGRMWDWLSLLSIMNG